MKSILTTSFAGAIALALPAVAQQQVLQQEECSKIQVCADANATVLKQVKDKVAAQPTKAAEVVKQTIIQTKADKDFVLQIAKVAVLTAPEQAEPVRKVIIALAPDAEKEVEVVIASVLQGDQVAQSSDAANAARDTNANAGNEPEGREPKKNTVWLTNWGALFEGYLESNTLPSFVQNTGISPNVNHNQGANTRGGTTVVIRPNPTTPVVP